MPPAMYERVWRSPNSPALTMRRSFGKLRRQHLIQSGAQIAVADFAAIEEQHHGNARGAVRYARRNLRGGHCGRGIDGRAEHASAGHRDDPDQRENASAAAAHSNNDPRRMRRSSTPAV